MEDTKVSMKDYILAMETVRRYEERLEAPISYEKNIGVLARCVNCKMLFPFTVSDNTERIDTGEDIFCFGECPYCGTETQVFRYPAMKARVDKAKEGLPG